MKKARVRFSDLLIGSGFKPRAVFVICGIPLVKSMEVSATAVDTHKANLLGLDSSEELDTNIVESFAKPLMPILLHIESFVEQDGTGDWSMSKSKLTVTYTDNSVLTLYFGDAKTGPETDSKVPLVHRLSIPMAPGWPAPNSIVPKYPPAPG